MTYRGAALLGGEHALIGTTEHGVLERRFVYDATGDDVFVAQLSALVQGVAVAQHQTDSGVSAPTVVVAKAPDAEGVDIVRVLVPTDDPPAPGEVSIPWVQPHGVHARGIVARALG